MHRDLVGIPSVNTGFMPTGNETPVCEYVRDLLARDGIHADILESAPGRGNLISGLEGASGRPGLMFMSHTDVVPIEDESKWRFPPFSATLSDGRIYGRGATDCKGLLTAQLMATLLLKRNGVPLQDGLILAAGADEEHGGRYGFGWLAENHPERITAPFAVNEGGGVPIRVGAGFVYALGVGEKGRLQVEIDIRGASAHASIPWRGDNALYPLAQALTRIQGYEAERDTSTELFNHLSALAVEHVASPENVDAIIAELESVNPPLASTPARPLPNDRHAHDGAGRHQVQQRAGVHPPHLRREDAAPTRTRTTCAGSLTGCWRGFRALSTALTTWPFPTPPPLTRPLPPAIRAATARALGMEDVQMAPSISTGFTDSRFTRNLGVVTYGYNAAHPDDDPGAHPRPTARTSP